MLAIKHGNAYRGIFSFEILQHLLKHGRKPGIIAVDPLILGNVLSVRLNEEALDRLQQFVQKGQLQNLLIGNLT